ncbi:MAG TPA: UvrD-helicase domain-containing protein [Vicinamibacterales bacterium]|nr:UvrD-helicase domain-containing protein [Vicinamibacterales bacterium]
MNRLPLFDPPAPVAAVDADTDARAFAVDPRNNVVLEASAGTGKTTVLVQRYVNLLKAGVEPSNILAITFTRKAATEMRERIVAELRKAARLSELDKARWFALRDRLAEISISTIDAFCLSLLREFPLEADLDPGFDMADETELPRLIEEALDRSMRIFGGLATEDRDVALVIAQLGSSRTRAGLASLLDRRLVARAALDRFLARGPKDLEADVVCGHAAAQLLDLLQRAPGGLTRFIADGPSNHPRYQLFVRQVRRLQQPDGMGDARIRAMLDRISLHFLTQDGSARRGGSIHPYNASHYPDETAARRHRTAVFDLAPQVERVIRQFARELNAVLARGLRRMFAVALTQYRETLDARSALDFSDVLERTLVLLRRMDEFSQSRFRLESRYHHVLVDEFQDTSRAQWELVSLLVQSWGEGMGLASHPSIFIVGDRKQSIYRFRDAEVVVLQEAGRYIEGLRPGSGARRAISRSFRAVPELLEFVNEVCGEMAGPGSGRGEFTYEDSDRFPPAPLRDEIRGPVLGISVADTAEECASAVAFEVERILRDEVVRDRKTGIARGAKAGDIAILFRSRTSHREFEHELEVRGIPTYVYKGLGFFDADEIKDACALLRYLAEPSSNLRAAALLRSGISRLSDAGLAALAPDLAAAVLDGPPAGVELDEEDARVLTHLRVHMPRWLNLVDRIPPADLFEQALPELAYAYEIRGPRRQQAWENLKKMRGLIRRIQNRGYATFSRIADHIDALSAGDESNAVLEAIDAVNLMTVHASKGLEFPIVFVVNMARGATGLPRPVRVIADGNGDDLSVSVAPFMSELDQLERDREQHETRRLLYVAMTRARDRLYLSSALKDGVLRPGPGSLADVLPDSLKTVFAAAAASGEATLSWSAPSVRTFTWRICRPPVAPASPAVEHNAAENADAGVRPADSPDLAWPAFSAERSIPRLPVTHWLQAGEAEERSETGSRDSALVGILVHRLFQASSRGMASDADPRAAVMSLVRADERAVTANLDRVVASALEIWERFCGRDDVVALMRSADVIAEVPFSMRVDERGEVAVVRGTIDCLAIVPDGSITVVELKTGGRRDAHQRQLEVYVRAARALFPGARVEGRLIYA